LRSSSPDRYTAKYGGRMSLQQRALLADDFFGNGQRMLDAGSD
jgi:hypothetical protein